MTGKCPSRCTFPTSRLFTSLASVIVNRPKGEMQMRRQERTQRELKLRNRVHSLWSRQRLEAWRRDGKSRGGTSLILKASDPHRLSFCFRKFSKLRALCWRKPRLQVGVVWAWCTLPLERPGTLPESVEGERRRASAGRALATAVAGSSSRNSSRINTPCNEAVAHIIFLSYFPRLSCCRSRYKSRGSDALTYSCPLAAPSGACVTQGDSLAIHNHYR